MYLLDTVVLSEFRKRQPHPAVLAWFKNKAAETLYVSVITVGEIERGIDRKRESDPIFVEALESWLNRLLDDYGDRVLAMNIAIAQRWGRLTARIGDSGIDLLIAATALEHDLIVVTRNVRHFLPTGVAVENPFAGGG